MNLHAEVAAAVVVAALCAVAAVGCFINGPVDNSCGVIVGVAPGNSAIGVGDADTLAATVVNSCGTSSDPTVTWKVQDTTVLSVQLAMPTSIIVVGLAHGNTQVRATANADTTAHVNATVFVQ